MNLIHCSLHFSFGCLRTAAAFSHIKCAACNQQGQQNSKYVSADTIISQFRKSGKRNIRVGNHDIRITRAKGNAGILDGLSTTTAATMAARTPALTYRCLSGDILTFETGTSANPDATSDTIEAALSWLLLEMCRPDTAAGSPTSGVLVALGNTAGDCPGHRVSHWL